MPNETYAIHLGDGAYASFGPEGLAITANHHEPLAATDVVWLDSLAVEKLLKFIASPSTVGDLVERS